MRAAATVAFHDPTGARHGLPTWPWGAAPAHLLTRTQLRERGLRPGGQPPAGQVRWRSRKAAADGWTREALLYDVRLARPRRAPSPAQLQALARALAVRRHCPRCRTDAGYVLSTRLGVCANCATPDELADLLRRRSA
ncbi:RRQRL motif-containing zinc-binding protein [Actinomadura nitritigenes]|uniref:RRQRL motif-containing zinc-binding protein n=1 Tax=Actinomadura nitritigenes TaxID=134602 RepID=UPI003D93EC36